jgi:hypothetical protein
MNDNTITEKGTYYIGSDQYAFETVATISPQRKVVRLVYEDRKSTELITISKRRDGKWREMGHDHRSGRYVFGAARTELDPSF